MSRNQTAKLLKQSQQILGLTLSVSLIMKSSPVSLTSETSK